MSSAKLAVACALTALALSACGTTQQARRRAAACHRRRPFRPRRRSTIRAPSTEVPAAAPLCPSIRVGQTGLQIGTLPTGPSVPSSRRPAPRRRRRSAAGRGCRGDRQRAAVSATRRPTSSCRWSRTASRSGRHRIARCRRTAFLAALALIGGIVRGRIVRAPGHEPAAGGAATPPCAVASPSPRAASAAAGTDLGGEAARSADHGRDERHLRAALAAGGGAGGPRRLGDPVRRRTSPTARSCAR